MNDEIIIGEGEKGNSWVVSRREFDFISENPRNYLIHLKNPIEFEIIIFKNTEQGKALKELLVKSTDVGIEHYVFKEVLKAIPSSRLPQLIDKKIKEEKEKSYEQGKQDKLDEIRNILGIL